MEASARQPNLVPAVLRDVRETLQMRWVDSAIEAAASYPVFFTAAWSAIRPNVGPTFLAAAKTIRELADAGVPETVTPHDDWIRLGKLGEADVADVISTLRAFHETSPKVAIVVHALAQAARGRRAGGSGAEEAPPKRGVPGWHPHVVLDTNDEAERTLEEAVAKLKIAEPPDVLVALSQWPGYVSRGWRDARRQVSTDAWIKAHARIRRAVAEAVRGLPHVISLQWSALKDRGFTEEERRDVGDLLARHDAAMPAAILVGTHLWRAAGSPQGTRGAP
ncbi:MAG: halocarboxylic acid dehydrogenase DehI family protein [Actinobacteria bacterium]|nr:halocarboxylic acid dehydrogenase DehI family protein [Actinomycetota bacterium]